MSPARAPRAVGLALVLACLAAAGCSIAPTVPPQAVFDLGTPPAGPGATGLRVRVPELASAPWLADTGMAYRLLYRDSYQREAYRDSRWAAAPAALVHQRMRQRLAQRSCSGSTGSEPPSLQLTVDEFSQVFESPTRSHGLVRLRASLGPGSETTFEARVESPGADARGAVQALARATDQVLEDVLAWVLRTDAASACTAVPPAAKP